VTPGEAHSLGAKVVTQKLALEGWSAHLLAEPETLLDRAGSEYYHFIGISVGHDEALLGLPDTIAEVRDVSRNRDVKVVVGGAVFDMPQDCYGFLGADLVTTSADTAVRYLRSDVRAHSALHN
jgi:methanogenic corrinoid protein MtbC1